MFVLALIENLSGLFNIAGLQLSVLTLSNISTPQHHSLSPVV